MPYRSPTMTFLARLLVCAEGPSEDSSRSHGLDMLNARGFLLPGINQHHVTRPPVAPLHRVPARQMQATQQRPLDYRQLLISRAMSAAPDQVSRSTGPTEKIET